MSLECTLKVCVEYSLHFHPYSRDVVKIMCWMYVYAYRALGLALADPTAKRHQLISYPFLTDWVWHMREMLLAGSFHLGFWWNLWVGWRQLFLLAGHGPNSELLSQKTLFSKKEHKMEKNQPMCQWITNCTQGTVVTLGYLCLTPKVGVRQSGRVVTVGLPLPTNCWVWRGWASASSAHHLPVVSAAKASGRAARACWWWICK